MRKLWLLFFCIFLSACGQEEIEVTKENLVGDWRCKVVMYERENSGANEDYGDPKIDGEEVWSFVLNDDDLFVVKEGEKQKIDHELLNREEATTEMGDYNFTTSQSTRFSDKDNYNTIIKFDVKNKTNMTDIIDLRRRSEVNCTRIK